SFYRKAFGGQLSSGFDITSTNLGAFASQSGATAGNDSLSKTVYASYSHVLPFSIQFSANGNYANQNLHYLYDQNLDSYGINIDLGKRVSNWDVRGRMDYRKQT